MQRVSGPSTRAETDEQLALIGRANSSPVHGGLAHPIHPIAGYQIPPRGLQSLLGCFATIERRPFCFIGSSTGWIMDEVINTVRSIRALLHHSQCDHVIIPAAARNVSIPGHTRGRECVAGPRGERRLEAEHRKCCLEPRPRMIVMLAQCYW